MIKVRYSTASDAVDMLTKFSDELKAMGVDPDPDQHEYVPGCPGRDSYLNINVPEKSEATFRRLVFGS